MWFRKPKLEFIPMRGLKEFLSVERKYFRKVDENNWAVVDSIRNEVIFRIFNLMILSSHLKKVSCHILQKCNDIFWPTNQNGTGKQVLWVYWAGRIFVYRPFRIFKPGWNQIQICNAGGLQKGIDRAWILWEPATWKKNQSFGVDDSLLFREKISKGIAQDASIEVVATASDPYEARDKIIEFKPDVMTWMLRCREWTGLNF